MKNPRVALAAVAAGTLIAIGAGYWLGVTVSRSSGQLLCTANPCRVTMTRNGVDGLVIQDARGPRLENALLIVDPSGLAEFWQNAAGAYEGPKGEICTTNAALAPVACLGSDGRSGWVRIGGNVLTSADIAWLHRAEGAVLTARHGPPGHGGCRGHHSACRATPEKRDDLAVELVKGG
ncbi:MAG TPA: hypothetical protein VN840_19125 [Streptosporangiaceae bacterium]|nr:hypothetical protein [Streptosporangiaceae bacterium]